MQRAWKKIAQSLNQERLQTMMVTKYAKTKPVAHRVFVLAALVVLPLVASAQGRLAVPPSAREQQLEQLTDRAIPPETMADAIVDFLPYSNMRLDVPSPAERYLSGQ